MKPGSLETLTCYNLFNLIEDISGTKGYKSCLGSRQLKIQN